MKQKVVTHMAYTFGFRRGHLLAKADKIARRYGAVHLNVVDGGTRISWFEVENCYPHVAAAREAKVWAAIDAAGGIEALEKTR